MIRALVLSFCVMSAISLLSYGQKQPSLPSYYYEVARAHEIKPHRRTIPHAEVSQGFNQLHLTLVVSPSGEVINSKAEGDPKILKFWPELQTEVSKWRFKPFEENGKVVTAQAEEYIDLVPPERFPQHHVTPPVLRTDSKISISLQRSGCYGTCPAYKVTVSQEGIEFDGHAFVVAAGKHRDIIDSAKVRALAARFIAADFYSMDSSYRASVTDNPSYVLSITIDERHKEVMDYVGEWVGMPAVITDLENEVDDLANTQRWINGNDGLVSALQAEKCNFQSYDAQILLKEAASRGQTETVRQLLGAGVPLKPIPAPKPKEQWMAIPFENVGWLSAASHNPETLKVLIEARASKSDQADMDLAWRAPLAQETCWLFESCSPMEQIRMRI